MIKKFYKISIFFFSILLCSMFFAKNSWSDSIISGISTNEIEIDTSFKGAKILLFGAKGYTGNIVVAVRGPRKDFILTKKKRLFGIWYNGKRVNLDKAYSYYSLFSTFSDQELPERLLSDLKLGKNNLEFNFSRNVLDDDKEGFRLHFLSELSKDKLYAIDARKVNFLNDTLFKVMLEFPKNISRGTYSVDIYLIDDDSLISFQSIPIYVNQVGVSAKILDFAHQQSLLYAIIAVFIALFVGWFTNLCFVKFFGK
jgi:uncharacterized protein (TIGR02186 family)